MPNNRRLEARVADVFHQSPDKNVILAPPAAVFSQWVEDLLVRISLLDGKAAHASIAPVALQHLWAEALDKEIEFMADGERNLAARQARSARRLLQLWWPEETAPHLARAFWSASKAVAASLNHRHTLAPEGWLLAMAERLHHPDPLPLILPEKLILDGFMEITALEQRVLDELARRGVVVEEFKPAPPPGIRMTLRSFPSENDEIAAAALWARQQVDEGMSQVAVVVHQLSKSHAAIRNAFENVFCTRQKAGLEDLHDCEFHLTQGKSISEHPVIDDALLLLSLSVRGLKRDSEFPPLSRLLLSPYWRGADSERSARARLEHRLRRDGRFWRSPYSLCSLAGAGQKQFRLPELLQALTEAARVEPAEPSGEGRARYFFRVLTAWGWPGPLARGSDVALLVRQFGKLLEQLAGLNPASDSEALSQLRQLCAESCPVMRGGPLSPVQIISPEDAVNRRFDAAWITNLHDGNWPGQPLQNSFLPPQARDRIPRSSAEGELAYTQRLTDELKTLAPVILFSYSRQTGDVPNSVSPLLADLEAEEVNQVPSVALHHLLAPETSTLNGYRNHPWLKAIEDTQGLRLSVGGRSRPIAEPQPDPTPIPGGSALFRDQSDCPMLAYFRHRLKARFEDMPTPFADAAYRGSLMHTAMHYLFAGQVGKPGVPAASAINAAVEAAMRDRQAAAILLPASFEAEKTRLENLLQQWLDFEGSRQGFTVEALEKEIHTDIKGHPIRLRVDRIDRLDRGDLMIIDYKSSNSSSSGWGYDRLRQAQLPLYAVLLSRLPEDAVQGAALATVRGGECTFSGFTANPEHVFQGINDVNNRRTAIGRTFGDWGALMRHWDQRIDALTEEILGGQCPNILFNPECLEYAGMEMLLRRTEGEVWLLEHDDARPGEGA